MTAQHLDSFDYQPADDHVSPADRRRYWAVATGLQRVDGLAVSPYLREVASSYVAGRYSLETAGSLVRAYHADGRQAETAEADLVSQRIAELLASAPFVLSPAMLAEIHRYLFQDLDPAVYHPGEFKTQRMVKQEEILNGDSVLYADPLAYDMALRAAFEAEQAKCYGTLEGEELAGFCHSMAFLWQIHPFYEGNTRTIAVFSVLYLNYLGFTVGNEPFESNARYFRDALVRAMYRNGDAGIFPDESFLREFYEAALGRRELSSRPEDLICAPLFEDPGLLRNVDPAEALHKR